MKSVVLLLIAAAAAAFLPGHWLELERGGALWRFITCHFTHWTREQLAWDGLALLALAFACARRNAAALQATLLASSIAIPWAVLSFTDLSAYRGLSGLASAAFALLLTLESRRSWVVAACAAGFVAKIAFETFAGSTVFVSSLGPGVVPVPIAHLAGALVGATVGLAFTIRKCASGSPCSSH